MALPLYHFLHYNVETEESSVHVLKLGRAITEEESKAKEVEEKGIKEGRVEEAKQLEQQKEVSDEQVRATEADNPPTNTARV